MIKVNVKVGDTVLMGKFKNKKTVIKTIGEDEHGMPTINGKKACTFRLYEEKEIKENITRDERISRQEKLIVENFHSVLKELDRTYKTDPTMESYYEILKVEDKGDKAIALIELNSGEQYTVVFIYYLDDNSNGEGFDPRVVLSKTAATNDGGQFELSLDAQKGIISMLETDIGEDIYNENIKSPYRQVGEVLQQASYDSRDLDGDPRDYTQDR